MEEKNSVPELLLRTVMWAAAYEAEDVFEPVLQWLFGPPVPEHETFIMQVELFYMKTTATAAPTLLKETGVGDRLLRILESLETPGDERQQYAVLYYALALGLAQVSDTGWDEGAGAGVPAMPLIPPRVGMRREKLPGENDPS